MIPDKHDIRLVDGCTCDHSVTYPIFTPQSALITRTYDHIIFLAMGKIQTCAGHGNRSTYQIGPTYRDARH